MNPLSRRALLIGLGCAAAAGAAAALEPRRRMSLLGDAKLEKIVPARFAGWAPHPSEGVIVPQDEDGLAARLYSQLLTRVYVHEGGDAVMLLIAYGDTQNDLLQLHRPEICYPAFGFALADNRLAPIPLGEDGGGRSGPEIPARALVAANSERIEQILYWTRIGEHLPTDGRSQRIAKLKDQFAGIIPDGVLVRVSNLLPDPDAARAANARFAADLIHAIAPRYRPALVGSAIAGRMG